MLSLFSLTSGIGVEMAIASRFGTSAAVDAFRIAMAIVYTGQQLFVGSFFPNLIVPLFAENDAGGHEAEAWRRSIALFKLVLAPTAVASLILFALPAPVVRILAPGLGPEAHHWAISFVRWFGVSLIPSLWAGGLIAILYARGIFWTSVAGQVAYNLCLLSVVLFLGRASLGPASMVVGVLLAAIVFALMQLVRLVPVVRRLRTQWCWFGISFTGLDFQRTLRLGTPLLLLPLLNQVSGSIAFWSLSAASVGTIAALGYAGKLMRMTSLVPDVMATVLFPKLAILAHDRDPNQLRVLATRAMRMALFLSLPIAGALFVLRQPLVALLFRHGAFSELAARRVGLLFGWLLIGMPGGILSYYLAKVLYALEDTWWPTCATIVSVIFAAIVMRFAASRFDAEGVAATYSCMAWVNGLVEAYALHSKYAGIDGSALVRFALRISAVSSGAALLGGAAARVVHVPPACPIIGLIMQLGATALVASFSYYLVTVVTGVPEALEIKRYIQWQSTPIVQTIKALVT